MQIGLGPAVARAGQRNAAGIGRNCTENDSVLLYVSAKPAVGVENFACEELVLIHGSTSFLFPLTGMVACEASGILPMRQAHKRVDTKVSTL